MFIVLSPKFLSLWVASAMAGSSCKIFFGDVNCETLIRKSGPELAQLQGHEVPEANNAAWARCSTPDDRSGLPCWANTFSFWQCYTPKSCSKGRTRGRKTLPSQSFEGRLKQCDPEMFARKGRKGEKHSNEWFVKQYWLATRLLQPTRKNYCFSKFCVIPCWKCRWRIGVMKWNIWVWTCVMVGDHC